MKLLIDDANVEVIRALMETVPVDGVTTNPSILAKYGRKPLEVLRELRALLGDRDLYVQTLSKDAAGMVAEGRRIARELGEATFIKIPAVAEGIRAIGLLASEGLRPAATTIYTPQQAYLASKAGAKAAIPYVNRIDNQGGDGVAVTGRIFDLFRKSGLDIPVVAASFKNARQVLALAEWGIDAATVGPDVVKAMLVNPAADAAVDAFAADFEKLCGPGATMLTC